jgi:anthranilate phosphoribosyltransferase
VRTSVLDATELGLRCATKEDLRGADPAHNAVMLRTLLEGKDISPRKDVVLLNAAAALATENGDLLYGLDVARRSLESGAALAKMEALMAYSQKLTGAKL